MQPGNLESIDDFWKFTDHLKVTSEYEYDLNMGRLATLPFEKLAEICLQYRFFTSNFATDLGYLVFRLPFGPLKSLMAQILAEELGDGKSERCHLQVYDDFLDSLAFWPAGQDYDALQLPYVNELMQELRTLLLTESVPFGVGLRGMAGECLCQIYLSLMAKNMRINPEIQKRRHAIKWKFWEIHEGEEDIHHRIITRAAIRDFVEATPGSLPGLVQGYLKGKETFDRFWSHLHEKNELKGLTMADREQTPLDIAI